MNVFSENISFNISKKMKNDLETIGQITEKKMSEVIRELIVEGMRLKKINMENRNYEPRKSDREQNHYCFD
jgi:hypothetical protein